MHRCSGIVLSLVVGFLFSSCSTTQVQMRPHVYTGAKATTAIMAVGQFTDQRKHAANWLGAIRGGYGNALKTLETPTPVKEVVREAFQDALRQRGLLASTEGEAKYLVTAEVLQYDCNQYVRREAHIKLTVQVLDRARKQQVFAEQFVVDNVEGSLLSLKTGVFASVDDLQSLAEKTLTQAIEEVLKHPQFTKLYTG